MSATNQSDIPWNRLDVIRVLEHIAETSPWAEDHHSSDYCIHCGNHVGNASLFYETGRKEVDMHRPECVYLLARDMLTGIKDQPTP